MLKIPELDLSVLDVSFRTKPLLIGGHAMAAYGLRPAGADIDFVVTPEDYETLARRYPDHLRDLWGDLGVCVYTFEVWKSICLHTYEDLAPGAIDVGDFLVISLEKLLLLKALAMDVEKYHKDLELIVQHIRDTRYGPWWEGLSEAQREKYQGT